MASSSSSSGGGGDKMETDKTARCNDTRNEGESSSGSSSGSDYPSMYHHHHRRHHPSPVYHPFSRMHYHQPGFYSGFGPHPSMMMNDMGMMQMPDPYAMHLSMMNQMNREMDEMWGGGHSHHRRHHPRIESSSASTGEQGTKESGEAASSSSSSASPSGSAASSSAGPSSSASAMAMNRPFYYPPLPHSFLSPLDAFDDWVWRTPTGNLLSLEDPFFSSSSPFADAEREERSRREENVSTNQTERMPEGEPAPHHHHHPHHHHQIAPFNPFMPTPFFGNELLPHQHQNHLARRFFGRDGVSTVMPRVDVRDTGSEFIVHADLPGMKKEDIKVDVKNGVLSISGDRKASSSSTTTTGGGDDESDRGGGDKAGERRGGGGEVTKTYRQERCRSRFYRAFTLPQDSKEKEIRASFENGVLEVSVPHEPQPSGEGPRSIQID